MSARYNFDRGDLNGILKVVIYTGITAVIASFIDVLPQIEQAVPVEYAVWFPVINTALVVVKKFFSNK